MSQRNRYPADVMHFLWVAFLAVSALFIVCFGWL